MTPELERLIHLQAVETRTLDARHRIETAPGRIAQLDAVLTASNDAITSATQALSDIQTARRTLEKDQLAVQQRLGKYKEQLMEVKTNHEYHAMQHQIEATTAELGRVEEQILMNMMTGDEATAALAAARSALEGSEADIRAERAGIEEEAREAERTIAASVDERAALVADIPPSTLSTFDRVLKARNGVAVALVVDGLCTVCRVRIRPMVYTIVRHNDQIVQCDSCQRILYSVPPPAAEPAADANA